MKDWNLEKMILSSKGEETRNCIVTVRISDAVLGLRKKERVIMNVRLVCGTMCAAGTVRGYGEWIQSTSMDKMVTDK